MEPTTTTINDLFAQLALATDDESIEAFIAAHPLPNDVKLIDAHFWTPRQAEFLKEQLREDAEWAMVVDELNVRLHKKPE
ncbi:DUF2789 domain-containing protein [Pseudomonas syringae pv. actinidiae]|uniref:DUF2789 domain-containing protein n=6 Tax=Pseudomonas syringae group TaxID=136849 RepID=A0A656JUK8_PSESF|nr:DUF2789 domain-containing protein [Pseudomonas syringae]EPN55021.1 hypothetical protein A245_24331 [Pseudomonas syringae pv. actinidiae ICMP 19096]EPN61902.1 hypothetical protein A235_21081 [Pseudomonas syringae pv. actinidiae ICMP 19079]EPN75304.1 hypothetical protein A234_16174 [Pseudomonas syringae pv. actinidiae ICMP 19101]OZI83809.1 DUF2789 domain-containing protein [Pseudomonas avellanae]AKT30078.1 hypothetical protein IYO_011165 [Pseudomonas syringae pv. actinidiae ICMP 18884]